jgi:hypothetical protein
MDQSMFMDSKLGLVLYSDHGSKRVLHLPWPQVRAIMRHIDDGKCWNTCPIYCTKEVFSFVLQYKLDDEQARYDV